MSEFDFVTHMSKAFTDKYGKMFASFFVNESIYGRYLSANDLYHMPSVIADETKPEKSNFTRDFDKYTKTAAIKNSLQYSHAIDVADFFGELKATNKNAKKYEKTYWEALYAHVCYKRIRLQYMSYENPNNHYTEVLKNIITDEGWYNSSIIKSIVRSVEFFRLLLFVEDITDTTFTFVHILDWFDILEFRIVPYAFKVVKEHFAGTNNKSYTANKIIDFLKEYSDYPFSERLGVEKQKDRKALWTIRKNMLPYKSAHSDVNLPEDIEIYRKVATLIRKRVGVDLTPIEKKGEILKYTSARNKLRQGTDSNGTSYTYALITDMDLGKLDTECMDVCLQMFKDLTTNTDISDIQNISSVISIHHMLYHEIIEEQKDDLPHPNLAAYKYDLEYTYHGFRRKVLEDIYYKYSVNKPLRMDVSLKDEYEDEILSEMIMQGYQNLVINSSDDILSKIFEPHIDPADEVRNGFINNTWNSLEPCDRSLCCLHANDKGYLERINRVDEKDLSSEEKDFAEALGHLWIDELNIIHNNLNF